MGNHQARDLGGREVVLETEREQQAVLGGEPGEFRMESPVAFAPNRLALGGRAVGVGRKRSVSTSAPAESASRRRSRRTTDVRSGAWVGRFRP